MKKDNYIHSMVYNMILPIKFTYNTFLDV